MSKNVFSTPPRALGEARPAPRADSGAPRGGGDPISWPGLTLIAGVTLVLAFCFLGSRGLGEPDEGRYVGVALDMVSSGRYLVPMLGDAPHLTKPPLAYWLSAAGMSLLGRNEWGARLFLGFVFAAHVLVVLRLGRSLGGRAYGRLSALVYATMLMPFAGASLVTTDTPLALFESLAVTCFVAAWRGRSAAPAAAWLVGMWASFGLAFLTKGPPGLLPLAAIVPFAVWERLAGRGRVSMGKLAHPAGLAVFAALGLGWYALVAAIHPELVRGVVGQEVWERAFGHGHGRNTEWFKPLTMYLPALILGTLPWSAVVPLALRRRREVAGLEPWARRLVVLWIVVPLAVLCVVRSRQLLYLLPTFTPLALLLAGAVGPLVGRSVRDGTRRRAVTRWVTAAVLAWAGVLVALRFVAAEVPTPRDARQVAERLRSHFDPETDELVMATPRFFGLSLYLDGEIRVATGKEPPVGRLGRSFRRSVYVARARQLGPLAKLFESPPPGCRVDAGPHDLLIAVCESASAPRRESAVPAEP